MKERKTAAVFVISVAAEMAGMHPQTLRIYERKGLVEPYRTPGGTRRYSPADIDRLGLIHDLTTRGLNLEGVRQVLSLTNELEALRAEVRGLREEAERLRSDADRRVREAHNLYRRDLVLRSTTLPQVRSKKP
ncbi:MAG: heat shock protein transcriptional repressor HspR [Acidimicrobiia bacterium]